MGIDWEFYTGKSGEELAHVFDDGPDCDYARYEESEQRLALQEYLASLPETVENGREKPAAGQDDFVLVPNEDEVLEKKPDDTGQTKEKTLNGELDVPDDDDYPF